MSKRELESERHDVNDDMENTDFGVPPSKRQRLNQTEQKENEEITDQRIQQPKQHLTLVDDHDDDIDNDEIIDPETIEHETPMNKLLQVTLIFFCC